jgi:hypothetical protein
VPPNVRCDDASASRTACQLYVGHESAHAALVRHDDRRMLRRWRTAARPSDIAFTAGAAAGLPWAPGCPVLVDDPPRTDLHVVASESAPLTSPPTADLRIA